MHQLKIVPTYIQKYLCLDSLLMVWGLVVDHLIH